MTTPRFALLGLAPAVIAFAAWAPYRQDPLNSTSEWTVNGPASFNSPGLRNTSGTPASAISTVAIPTNAPYVDAGALVQLTAGNDTGTYVVYTNATSDARYGPGVAAGTFFALVVQANATSSGCTSTFTLYKQLTVGAAQTMWSGSGDCYQNSLFPRMVWRNNPYGGNVIGIYNYNKHLANVYHSDTLSGKPGVGGWGMSSSSAIIRADLGAIEMVNPITPPVSSIAVSTNPYRVDFQFPGTQDDANGTGMAFYALYRAPFGTTNWSGIGEMTISYGQFSDNSVQPSTAYTYRIDCHDFHLNYISVQFNATTPSAGSIDPRRTGLPATDPTFGAMGANINLLSGNVNFNLPLLKAQARGGWGVTFALNHDTQTWKKEGSIIWKYGFDTGYGFGWKLLAGSVTRYYASTGVTSHIVFTDSTGAEYRLDRKVNHDGSNWTTGTVYWAASSANFYGIFEEEWSAFKMHFPDGSTWTFGSHAAGNEGDLGTAYPTLFEANGNQVAVRYKPGSGVSWPNSSGRIDQIEDVRAKFANGTWATYEFNWDSAPHLTSITNRISTSEGYTFTHAAQTLYEPFTSTAWPNGANTDMLTGVIISGVGLSYALSYQSPGTGELAKVTMPYGGYVGWQFANWLYTGTRTLRDASQWFHSKSGSAGDEKGYPIFHEGNDGSKTLHQYTSVVEPDWSVYKAWDFNASGLATRYSVVTGATTRLNVDSTWNADANGKPYIGATVTTYDPWQSYAKSKRTEQTIDQYGNMTQMKLFDWGNNSTARRVYANTFLSGSPYSSLAPNNVYIKNRLLTSTYQENGGTQVTLVQNAYDEYSPSCPTGGYSCAMTATSGARQKNSAYTTSFTLRGNLTSSSRYGDGSQLTKNSTWSWRIYDDTGNVIKARSPQYVWGTAVEDSGKNYAVPSSLTVAGLTSTMGWNDALGLTSAGGANGESASTAYDSYARPSSKTSPTGQVTTFDYSVYKVVKATTNGRYVKTTVDGLGRTLLTETGYGTTAVSIVESVYEPCACTPIGKLKKTSRPYAPGTADGSKKWTVYSYDALGRTVSVVAPDGSSTTSYLYQGNTVKVTDAAGKWKQFAKDAMGNLTQVNEPNPAGGSDYVTTYTYDAFDRLYQVSMPRPTGTQTRTFSYGSNGQMSSKIEPETGSTTFFYNSDATLDYKLDANGGKTKMIYDGNKRVTQVQKFPGPSGATEDVCQRVEMFYDGAYPAEGDAGVSQYVSGRLSAVKYRSRNCTLTGGHTFVEQYSYLQYGAMVTKRLKVIRNTNGSGGTATGVLLGTAEYDGEGRMLAYVYPVTGRRVQYGYDSRGLPSMLTDTTNSVTLVSSVTYDVAGQMTVFVSGGGTETRSYNEVGQMTQLNLPGRSITYNFPSPGANNGKLVSMVESGETISYQYDSLQRLASATGSGWSQGYSYDGFGNLTGKAGTGSAPSWSSGVDAATNRLSGLSYDANGNQLSAPMTTGMPDAFNLTYDVSNRLTVAQNAAQTMISEYDYDAGNKRVHEKRTGSAPGEWFYFFGVTGQRLARYNFTVAGASLSFTQDTASVWFGGKLVQKVDTFGSAYASEDRLGSVGKYLPYGEDKPGASNPSGDNEKFATYTRDGGTGLDYADQRWHKAGTGRFLTSDPYQASGGAGNPASWNRYGYVEADPINNNDPKGLATCNYPGRWTTYRDELGRHTESVLVHCTSLAGTINDSSVYEYLDAATDADIAAAFDFVGRRADALEEANFSAAITASTGRLQNVSESCWKAVGASSLQAFQDRMKSLIGTPLFADFGPLTVRSEPNGGWTPVPNSTDPTRVWPVARFSGAIRFNRRINWSAPNQTFATSQFGGVRLIDLPGAYAQQVGASTMSNNQFVDLAVLHELSHAFGNTHPQGVADEYNKVLWRACFE